MKSFVVGFFLLLIALNIDAQDAFFQVITCRGTVVYEGVEGKEKEVVPGAKIPAEGNLKLGQESMVKIICKDRPQKLQTPGTYDLSELYYSSDKKSMSFTGKFWNYLMKGLQSSDSKAEIKKYGYQSAAGGIKGFSSIANSEVEINSPVVGKVSRLPILFDWEGEACQFLMFDEKNEIVLDKVIEGSEYELLKAHLDIVPGLYYWQIKCGDKTSPIIPFEYQPLEVSKIESKLSRITDYVEGEDMEKSWIRAVVYEMEDYTYEAGQMYQSLLENYPDDLLIKKLYIMYLAKNGSVEKAEKLID